MTAVSTSQKVDPARPDADRYRAVINDYVRRKRESDSLQVTGSPEAGFTKEHVGKDTR